LAENKFPPKFSQQILYPAIYDLDKYEIPNGYDITSNDNIYFDIEFDGFGLNQIPILSYGKHRFSVYITQPASSDTTLIGMDGVQYTVPGGLPRLKTGTRILFEFKDPVGNIVFSDVIPNYGTQGFSGYVWVKQDPLRTTDDIQEGYGTFRMVAHTVNFDVVDSNDVAYQNPSPIVLQNTTSSMGSGSGLEINEVLVEENDAESNTSNASISCSKLLTYGGKIQTITTFMKISGSADGAFNPLADHSLTSSIYENEIHKDYSMGINTQSEKFQLSIPNNLLQENGSSGNNVKFRLKFKNPFGNIAKDPNNPLEDFILDYPKNENEWLSFNGSTLRMGTNLNQKVWNENVVTTSEGQYSFAPDSISAPSGSGGQKYRTGTGKLGLQSYGSGDSGNVRGGGGQPAGGGGTT
jgi:hypothetical protein